MIWSLINETQSVSLLIPTFLQAQKLSSQTTNVYLNFWRRSYRSLLRYMQSGCTVGCYYCEKCKRAHGEACASQSLTKMMYDIWCHPVKCVNMQGAQTYKWKMSSAECQKANWIRDMALQKVWVCVLGVCVCSWGASNGAPALSGYWGSGDWLSSENPRPRLSCVYKSHGHTVHRAMPVRDRPSLWAHHSILVRYHTGDQPPTC